MADDTATADPAAASQDELRRKIMEELQRRQQQQPEAAAAAQPQFSGFTLSAEASEKQRKKREEEAAARQKQQREFDDIFLKTLAKIYGLPPQAESFKPEFVPILMACTVEGMPSPDVMLGKFAGARELPRIQIARDHVITQGGQMTPELAMQMAMLAAANPDMQREGVEIQGVTEEDKLMLFAAAQLLGLKVLNPPKIDNEQTQAQRIEACKQGWQNLNKWAQPGPAQPAPQPAPGPDSDDEEQSAQPRPAPGPGSSVPPVIPVPGTAPPGDAGKQPAADNAAAGKIPDYDKLDDDQKNALRKFFRAASGVNLPDEQIDQELRPGWNSLDDEKRKALLAQAKSVQERMKKQAEAAAAPEPLTAPPPPSQPPPPDLKPVGQRTYKELLPPEKKLLQEDELTKQNKPGGGDGGGQNKTKLSKQEQKALADRWDGMGEEDRTKLYDDAGKLEADLAEKAEKARQAKIRKLAKENDAAFEKQKQDHDAQVKLFDDALAASDPSAPRESPALKPVEDRKFDELLPSEQKLLIENELTRLKKNSLSDDEKKALAAQWDGMDAAARKAHFTQAGVTEGNLATAVDEERKAAVKALTEAAERAAAKEAAKAAEKDAAAKIPRKSWAELSEEDKEEIREYCRREWPKDNNGKVPKEESEFSKPWDNKNFLRNGDEQQKMLENIKRSNVEARAAAAAAAPPPAAAPDDDTPDDKAPAAAAKPVYKFLEERTFDELPVPAQEILNKHFLERKAKEGEIVAAGSAKEEWDALDDAGKMARMEEGFKNHPEMSDAVMNALQAEIDAAKSPAPVPAAGSPVAAPKPDEKPRRSFGQFVRDLLRSAWTAISYPFRETPKPAVEAGQTEPVAEVLPEAPPAPGVEEVSKKKFSDLLHQEQRALLIDNASNGGRADSFPAKWDALDESGRAALFNQAMNNNPPLHDAVVAAQTESKKPAPAQNLEPAVEKQVAAETPNLVKDAGDRKWSELLDAEKEAAQLYFDGADPESGWNSASAADRNTAIQLGIETKPELAAKIEQARKAENERLAAATTPPPSNTDRVRQRDAIIAATPPPSNAARVEQKDNLAAVTAAPAVVDKEAEQDVPKDDPAFESALKAKGLTRDALLAMPPDQRKGVLAEIKQEQEKEKAPQPVVEVRRDEPAAPPVVPSESMTVAFNNISLDNIHELPPSNDARRVIQNQSLPKSIDKDRLLQAYQQIRAEVVRQQAASPGFRVSQAFLGEAARKNHTEGLLGHKGLRPEEAHAILDCLREEGLTTGKKDTHRNVSYAANDWQAQLASHYKPEM